MFDPCRSFSLWSVLLMWNDGSTFFSNNATAIGKTRVHIMSPWAYWSKGEMNGYHLGRSVDMLLGRVRQLKLYQL